MEHLTEQLKQLDQQIVEITERLRALKKARRKIASALEHLRDAE